MRRRELPTVAHGVQAVHKGTGSGPCAPVAQPAPLPSSKLCSCSGRDRRFRPTGGATSAGTPVAMGERMTTRSLLLAVSMLVLGSGCASRPALPEVPTAETGAAFSSDLDELLARSTKGSAPEARVASARGAPRDPGRGHGSRRRPPPPSRLPSRPRRRRRNAAERVRHEALPRAQSDPFDRAHRARLAVRHRGRDAARGSARLRGRWAEPLRRRQRVAALLDPAP